jgi:hypothetical protein
MINQLQSLTNATLVNYAIKLPDLEENVHCKNWDNDLESKVEHWRTICIP